MQRNTVGLNLRTRYSGLLPSTGLSWKRQLTAKRHEKAVLLLQVMAPAGATLWVSTLRYVQRVLLRAGPRCNASE